MYTIQEIQAMTPEELEQANKKLAHQAGTQFMKFVAFKVGVYVAIALVAHYLWKKAGNPEIGDPD